MQGQLGLNYKNPVININTTDDDKYLNVYIGFRFFAIIPNDPKTMRYRLLVSELAMAGFAISSLMTIFGFTRPTIMKYRDIVENTHNEDEMFDRLRGYNSIKTKITPDVESYIINRFPLIYKNNRVTYNQQLRNEISKKFDIALSPEAIRTIIAPLRKELDGKSELLASDQTTSDNEIEQLQIAASADEILLKEAIIPSDTQADTTADDSSAQPGDNEVVKNCPNLYAGLLIMNFWIAKFIPSFGNLSTTFLQWIYQIFFAAVNFEQARYLSHELLGQLIGTPAAISVSQSRSLLKELAENKFTQTVKMLFKANLECIQKYWKTTTHYFYIDGHFDPYYGKTGILKGWNCILNRTMKGTNHYAIHDMNGYPLVKDLKDCFRDFRDYIKDAISKINKIVSNRPFGIVFDRGGFSQNLFCEFQSQGKYFITWEKHFDIKKEPELNFDTDVTITREVNDVGHFKTVCFKCAETTFHTSNNFSCRKIIISTQQEDSNGDKSDFYAGILTNDPAINHQTLVELMTNRWQCQENDFKYEKKHFGLDQITSYSTTPQESIKELIAHQQADIDALIQQKNVLQAKKKSIYDTLGIKRLTKKCIQKIENKAGEHPENFKLMLTARALQPELTELTIQIDRQKKKLKRLKKIEKRGYIRLDYRRKQIFDHVRFSCRNIFYMAVNEFKSYYPNLRDYHDVFRKLIRASGDIEFSKEQVIVNLYCPFFTGRVLRAVHEFVEYLNNNQPTMLDGTNREITFIVNSKVAN